MKILMVLVACIFIFGCTNESGAKNALDNEGYTQIQITGWSPFHCGDRDLTSTGFRAMNARGKPVSGVVCCGILKNCTIRW